MSNTPALAVFLANQPDPADPLSFAHIGLWTTDGSSAGTQLVAGYAYWGGLSYPQGAYGGLAWNGGVVGGQVVFAGYDAAHGWELWHTDGTAAGTGLLVDLRADGGAIPDNFLIFGNQLLFTADAGGTTNRGLWTTDGTAAGTHLLVGIEDGSVSASPLSVFGDTVLFTAITPGIGGPRLFAHDSVTAATTPLLDLGGMSGGTSGVGHAITLGSEALFVATLEVADTSSPFGFMPPLHPMGLWASDGTAAGTHEIVELTANSPGGITPGLTALGTLGLFIGPDQQLWRTDGTAAGTYGLTTLAGGVFNDAALGDGSAIVAYRDHAYFAADDGVHGVELWRTDGTAGGTELVADINPGGDPSYPVTLSLFGEYLYFTAGDAAQGAELWRSDGSAAGTMRVAEIGSGEWSGQPSRLLALAGSGTAPLAPSAPDLLAADDHGTSSTDNLTDLAQPRLVGTAEAGSTVEVFDDATSLGTTTATADGAWSLTPAAALAVGSHSLTAVASNAFGASTASDALALEIDLSAPPLSLALNPSSDTGYSQTDFFTAATQPLFIGITTPGLLVTLLDGATVLGSAAAAAGSGRWTFQPGSALAQGEHSITAQASDTAGNLTSVSHGLTIGSSSLATPAAPGLAAGHDTGAADHDGQTNERAPSFAGTAAPGSVVTLRVDGVAVASGSTDAGTGAWQLRPGAALAEGSHVITVTAADRYATSTASAVLDIVIDSTAPGQPSLGLAPGEDNGVSDHDLLTNHNRPTLAGVVGGASSVTLWDFTTIPGVLLGSTTVAADGGWSIASGVSLSDGTHLLMAFAEDAAGNSSGSEALTITVDTGIGHVTIGLASGVDDGRFDDDGITAQDHPGFTGTAPAGASVALVEGATTLATVTANGSGTWAWTPAAALADGSHGITARIGDDAGNTSAASTTVLVDTATPAAPPPPRLVDFTDTGIQGDGITAATHPFITGSGAEAGALVRLYVDGTLRGAGTADANGDWGAGAGLVLDPGSYGLTAVQIDKAGHASAASAAFSLTIVAPPPAPTVPDMLAAADTGGSSDDNITRDTRPVFAGLGPVGATIHLKLDGQEAGTAAVEADGSWQWQPDSALAEGRHSLTAYDVSDVSGAVSVGTFALSFLIDTAPETPVLDAASDTGASDGDGITNATTLHLHGHAWHANETVWLLNDDGGAILATFTADADGDWAGTVELDVGTHHLAARGVDGGVLSFSASARMTVVVDTSVDAMQAPVLTTDGGRNAGDGITRTTSNGFSGNTEAFANVSLKVDGSIATSTTADAAGAWSVSGVNLAEGSHAITAFVTDLAGNTATSPVRTAVADRTAPAAPGTPDLLASSDDGTSSVDNVTSIDQPVFQGTAEAGATVTLHAATTAEHVFGGIGSVIGSGIASSDGHWTISTDAPLALGEYYIKAKATDAAGNTGVASVSLPLTIEANHASIVFAAQHDGINALYVADQARGAANWVADIGQGTASTALGAVHGGMVFAGQGATSGNELWFSGGSAESTFLLKDINPGSGDSDPLSFTPFGDRLLFSADDGVHGRELWITDGTSAGTRMVADINAGSALGSNPYDFHVLGDTVVFRAFEVTSRFIVNRVMGIYVTDGTEGGTHSLGLDGLFDTFGGISDARDYKLDNDFMDLNVSEIDSMAYLGGKLIFAFNGHYEIGRGTKIWSTDGTVAGTTPISGFISGLTGSGQFSFFGSVALETDPYHAFLWIGSSEFVATNGEYNNTILFSPPIVHALDDFGLPVSLNQEKVLTVGRGTDPDHKNVMAPVVVSLVWATGGPQIEYYPINMLDYYGDEYAIHGIVDLAGPGGGDYLALGTENGVSHALFTTSSAYLHSIGDTRPRYVFVTDGTDAGTYPVSGIDSGGEDPAPEWLLAHNHQGWFAATSITAGRELYYTTNGGRDAVLLADLNPGTGGSNPYFAAAITFNDTYIPDAPGQPVLDAVSDTGSSSTDGITMDATPTFTGTAERYALVTLYEGAVELGSAKADAAGTWSITSRALASGTHGLAAKAQDAAGNVSVLSAVASIEIRPTATTPTAPDLLAGADLGTSSVDNLTGTAGHLLFGGTGHAGDAIDLLEGDTLLASGSIGSDGHWQLDVDPALHPLAGGAHALHARVTDLGGAVAAGAELAVFLSAAAPGIGGTITTAQAVTDKGSIAPFATATVSDTDPGSLLTAHVTLADASHGMLANLGGGSYDVGTGVWSFTGSAAAVTTALDGLTFLPRLGLAVTTGFSLEVTDQVFTTATPAATVIASLGTGSRSLVLGPDDSFTGTVDLAALGITTITLTGTGGTLSGLGSSITGFIDVVVPSGTNWTLAGDNTLLNGQSITGSGTLVATGTLRATEKDATTIITVSHFVNQGLVVICNGDPLIINGDVVTDPTNPGVFDIGLDGELVLNGAVDAGQSIHFTQAGGILQLGDATDFLATLHGFSPAGGGAPGDRIILAGIADLVGVTLQAGNLLLLDRAGAPDLVLHFDAAQDFAGALFGFSTDGTASTITLSSGLTLGGSQAGETLRGGAGADHLGTTWQFSALFGGAGPDSLAASGYADSLMGEAGDDSLVAGGGAGSLDGGAGNDSLAAGGWGSRLAGGEGDDVLRASGGGSTLDGGAGDNRFAVEGWGNSVSGGDGHNSLTGGAGGGVVTLGDGGNTVTLPGYGNQITTGRGDDVIDLGSGGGDVVDAGDGSDTVRYSATSNQYRIVHNQDGSLTVQGPSGTDTLRNVEVVQFADTVPVPPGPPTVADGFAVTQGATLLGNVLTNDIAAFGHPLYVTGFHIEDRDYAVGAVATLAGGALFSIAADGTVTLDQRHAYDSLGAGATRELSFSYVVNEQADGSGASADGDASIELTGLNDAPVAGADSFAVQAGAASALGSVLGNDHDPDTGDTLHVLSFDVEGQQYAAGVTATLANGAQISIAPDGSVTLLQNHHFDSAGATIGITYALADAGGLGATSTASIVVQPLPVGTGSSQATGDSGQHLTGTAGNDTLTATGWNEVIHAGAGDDVISGGNGCAVIDAGDGNNHITVHGHGDSITAGNGDNTLVGPEGSATVSFGNGTASITLAGGGNRVEIGATPAGQVSTIIAGSGNDTVISHETAADGDVHVILSGYGDTVMLGAGNNTVEGAQGNAHITTGDGNDSVDAHGFGNVITLGLGHDVVHAGSGGDTVVTGGGTGNIWLSGWGNTVDARLGGDIAVHAGAGNDLFIAPAAGLGVEQIFGFNADAGDKLEFIGAGSLSFQVSGSDLLVLAGGVEVVDLVGLGGLNPASLASHGSLLFA